MITRAQVRDAGVAWSTLSRLAGPGGPVERVAHGVYRLRGSADPGDLALRAAWLQLDPGVPAWERLDDPNLALVSHTSAAALYDVGDLRADTHEFTLPVRRQSRRPDVRLHRSQVPAEDWTVLRGLPTTRAGRMVADLLAGHYEPGTVGQVIHEVLARALEHPAVLTEKIAPFAARFGQPRGDGPGLLELLRATAGPAEAGR